MTVCCQIHGYNTFFLNFLFVYWYVKLKFLGGHTQLREVFAYSESSLTLSASMHWPSGPCSTSKTSEKRSSTWDWESTSSVYWQFAFSAYELGQEGLDMIPLLFPDRSSLQFTVNTRDHCHHLHFNEQNHKFYTISTFPKISPQYFCFLYFPIFTSLCVFLSPSDVLNPDSVECLEANLIICTSASVVVHIQVVAVATGAVVPSDEVVTELGALVDFVILAFVIV